MERSDAVGSARFVFAYATRTFSAWLLASILLSSVLDLFGIAIIFPYLKAVVEPDTLARLTRALPVALSGLQRNSLLILLSAGLGLAYLGKSLVQSLLLRYQSRQMAALATRVGDDIVGHLLGAEYAQFLRTPGSELGSTAFAGPVHVSLVYRAMLQVANELVFLCLLFAVFFVVSPQLTIGALSLLTLAGLAIYFFVIRATARLGRKQADAENARYRLMFSMVTSIRDIKVMGLTTLFSDLNGKVARDFESVAWRYNFNHALPLVIVEATVLFGVIGSVLGVVISGADFQSTLPLIGVAAITAIRVIPAFSKLFSSLNALRFYGESVRRFAAIRQTLIENRHVRKPDALAFQRSLELKDVCFFHGDTCVLDRVSLRFEPGRSYGIVGPSGSGKSTLLDVLTGLQRSGGGTFLCDEAPFDPFESASLPKLVGYVPQSITLVDASIAFNIAFVEAYDERRMAQALRMAHLTHLIESLPQGLQTPAGENGTRLSGGQRQRIGLARAFYHQPTLLVLDEATSALDPLTEREIARELLELRGQLASITVSHRIAAVKDCDEIIVIEGGRVSAKGRHDVLVQSSSLYADMYRSQHADSELEITARVHDQKAATP